MQEKDDSWLQGKKVAVAGRLASMTHANFAELIAERGGEFLQLPNRTTAVLVIGQEGWPLQRDGRQTVSLERARRIRACGYPLELVHEEEFLHRLGMVEAEDAVRRRCTITQLSRLLNVPGSQLRAWMRTGLIEPVEIVHRLAYFDFRQVASAKTLCDLTQAGVTPQHIRDSLEHLRNWLPGIETPLVQLRLLEQSGRLLIRHDGKWAEPGGQLQFDFVAGPFAETGDPFSGKGAPEPALLALRGKTADAWFEEALALEDLGHEAQAEAAYREAIRLDPDDPVFHFNLGNILCSRGELREANDEFRRALESDPAYVEAWNNLGVVLAALHLPQDAIFAYERALQLVPRYADAHYNLANLLAAVGREAEARSHWRAYLQLDPHSSWSEDVRRRLAGPPHD